MNRFFIKTIANLCLVGSALQAVAASEIASFVALGPEGQAIARVITRAAECPLLEIEGRQVLMGTRIEPREKPLSADRPAIFPVRVCEHMLPSSGNPVLLDGKKFPSLTAAPRKIVLLGDTGCRMKWPVYQNCDDSKDWPLAQVARSAAAERPDLIIHVGDYHYRESPCLGGGCANSPQGYGSDTWEADFFEPMGPLLRAAPWVFARGNHESCARAGQGWFRFLDPHPYDTKRSCDEPVQAGTDVTAPYAVPLGPDQQLIVFDSAGAAEQIPRPDSPAVARYGAQFEQVAALARNRPHNWLLLHHPVLGYGYLPLLGYHKGNPTLLAALQEKRFSNFFPEGIQLTLQGHIHTFELNRFEGREPLSLITGFAGSLLEPEYPKRLPNHFQLAPGIVLAETRTAQEFGYTVLEQQEGHWMLQEKDIAGRTRLNCLLQLEQAPYEYICSAPMQ